MSSRMIRTPRFPFSRMLGTNFARKYPAFPSLLYFDLFQDVLSMGAFQQGGIEIGKGQQEQSCLCNRFSYDIVSRFLLKIQHPFIDVLYDKIFIQHEDEIRGEAEDG